MPTVTRGMSLDKRAMLAADGIAKQPFCCACGTSGPTQMHHAVRRSQGGGDGPTLPLCVTCHSKIHDQRMLVLLKDGAWFFSDDELTWPAHIYDEATDPPAFEDALTDDDGVTLHDIEGHIRELTASSNGASYYVAKCVEDAHTLFAKRYPGRAARVALTDWAKDTFGFSSSSVSKRLAWASLPPVAAVTALGLTKGYEVARAVSGAVCGLDEAITDIEALTLADFRAKHFGKKPLSEREWCECPKCGRRHPAP
jgi:hypothetical protein